jgi:hypothetical protein
LDLFAFAVCIVEANGGSDPGMAGAAKRNTRHIRSQYPLPISAVWPLFGNRQEKSSKSTLSAVYLLSQFSRALKCDNLSLLQYQVLASGWISATALALVFDAKLAKTADQDILTVLQGFFNDLNETFDHLGAFVFGKR